MEKQKTTVTCHACQKELSLEFGEKIGRQDECTFCGNAIRCCKMCRFYDGTHYNQCREPLAERVVEKEKFNFCNYYVLAGGNQDIDGDRRKSIDLADSLFKN